MKYVIIAVLAIGALFTAQQLYAEFSMPKPLSKEDLAKVASRAPDTQMLAVVEFNQAQALQNLEMFINDSGVQLKSFTVATENRTSGYVLVPDRSIQEAVSEYQRDRIIFGQKTTEMTEQISTTIEKDSNTKKSPSNYVSQSYEQDLSPSCVTSIEVIGSAGAVLRWQTVNNQNVSIKYVFDVTRMKQ